jgi:hypothetical protein
MVYVNPMIEPEQHREGYLFLDQFLFESEDVVRIVVVHDRSYTSTNTALAAHRQTAGEGERFSLTLIDIKRSNPKKLRVVVILSNGQAQKGLILA